MTFSATEEIREREWMKKPTVASTITKPRFSVIPTMKAVVTLGGVAA